jgi:alkanesulfonate monooxygenase SsuD/methylene tetrahydromethanopterin reductase-like flavin-dependent oxidoreductase (luciferase family)
MKFGLQTGQQDCTYEQLRDLWRLADGSGFYWVSIWDHHFESPPAGGQRPAFETIAIMSALALETTNVRVGCLVFSSAYRNPGIVAKAITTIDHLSNGRVEVGLGAGWHEPEYKAFGINFPRPGIREDMLEEAAQIIRQMLHEGEANFQGEHYQMTHAYNVPAPVQSKIRLWVGGAGEKRTIPAAAKYADAWNGAYVAAEVFKHKLSVLAQACEAIDRDPSSMDNAINLGFYMGVNEKEASKKRKHLPWGPEDPRYHGQILGTPDQAVDQIGKFIEAGAQQVNLAMRAPFDIDAIQAFTEQVMPAFKGQ